MAESNMKQTEFENLIAAWLDGRLDEDGSQALQKKLCQSASAREEFLRYAGLDVALHEVADTSGMMNPSKLAAIVAEANTAELSSTDSQERVLLQSIKADEKRVGSANRATFSSMPSSSMSSWFMALAVGMLLAVTLIGYVLTMGDPQAGSVAGLASDNELANNSPEKRVLLRRPPAPVATLSSVEGALWEKSQREVGEALYEGEWVSLLEGKARISIGFGAEIVASAPCSLTVLSKDRVELHEGNVAVDVAPWAVGFTVATEEMDVVDLGTTFTVSATPGMKSETTVLKGVVRVHPSKFAENERRGLLVSEGRRMSIDGMGSHENVREENVQQLLGSLDFGATGPYRPVDLKNTGIGLSAGDEDQHWRVVAGPEKNFGGQQFASVCVPHEAYLPNDPQKSQWISVADWETAAANSTYTFRTEFDLNDYNLSTIQLFGRFLADNGIEAVRVNGNPVRVQSWVDNVWLQPFGDSQFRFVNITEGLAQGRNVIEVDVRNGMMRQWDKNEENVILSSIPNPMALRVEWYAFGRPNRIAGLNENSQLFHSIHNRAKPLLTLSHRKTGS